MQVEIDEVVATIRVRDRGAAHDPVTERRLIEAVLRIIDDRGARARQRTIATDIPDDGRGAIFRGDEL